MQGCVPLFYRVVVLFFLFYHFLFFLSQYYNKLLRPRVPRSRPSPRSVPCFSSFFFSVVLFFLAVFFSFDVKVLAKQHGCRRREQKQRNAVSNVGKASDRKQKRSEEGVHFFPMICFVTPPSEGDVAAWIPVESAKKKNKKKVPVFFFMINFDIFLCIFICALL